MRRIKAYLIVVSMAFLVSCSTGNEYDILENSTLEEGTNYMLPSEDVIPQKLFGKTKTAICVYNEGTQKECTDLEKISVVKDILKSAEYQKLELDDWVEGGYWIDFVQANGEIVELTVGGGHYISIEGAQYFSEQVNCEEILDLLDFSINEDRTED